MQKIIPFLWFNDQAEEAVNFYISIFKNSKIIMTTYYGEASSKAAKRPKGTVMTIRFQLEGQEFIALNGGPEFKFTPAISLLVNCLTQEEIDHLWKKLTEGGEEVQCGWLKDRFGISWQIVPITLPQLIDDPNHEKGEQVMRNMLKMKKIDMKALTQA